MDTQDCKPDVEVNLKRVGITKLKTPIQTEWNGKSYRFSPTVEITIDLEKTKKGIHMSRLVEAIAEAVEKESRVKGSSIEEIGAQILDSLSKNHPFRCGEINMDCDFFTEKLTPATQKPTIESHEIKVTVNLVDGVLTKKIRVSVLGNTVCPHSMEVSGIPHIQRARGILTVESSWDKKVDIEKMIECVEDSFSSEVYTLLKTEDEAEVVKKMHKNPRFVEDVVRQMLYNANKSFCGAKIHAKAVSEESIHRHDVIAEGTIE